MILHYSSSSNSKYPKTLTRKARHNSAARMLFSAKYEHIEHADLGIYLGLVSA
jgi:hypothetical protein